MHCTASHPSTLDFKTLFEQDRLSDSVEAALEGKRVEDLLWIMSQTSPSAVIEACSEVRTPPHHTTPNTPYDNASSVCVCVFLWSKRLR